MPSPVLELRLVRDERLAEGVRHERVGDLARERQDLGHERRQQALVREAQTRGLDLPDVTDFEAIPGQGIRGTVEGKHVILGSADFLTAQGFDAVNVAGGTSAWVRSGLPIEK